MDTSKISLPLQIAGFLVAVVGFSFGHNFLAMMGFAAHFAGDVMFFFQMRSQGCL